MDFLKKRVCVLHSFSIKERFLILNAIGLKFWENAKGGDNWYPILNYIFPLVFLIGFLLEGKSPSTIAVVISLSLFFFFGLWFYFSYKLKDIYRINEDFIKKNNKSLLYCYGLYVLVYWVVIFSIGAVLNFTLR